MVNRIDRTMWQQGLKLSVLSLAVIASLNTVAAEQAALRAGLDEHLTRAAAAFDGLEAGLAIVILAVVIDRITQAYGRPRHEVSK